MLKPKYYYLIIKDKDNFKYIYYLKLRLKTLLLKPNINLIKSFNYILLIVILIYNICRLLNRLLMD
jgi:hypothetical protein